MPEFAGNVTLPFAIANGLNNTGIVQVELFQDQPFVTNWQGTPINWPGQEVAAVPLPASLPLLLVALGSVAALRRRRSV
jgi:probable phosphoglycerate mutase